MHSWKPCRRCQKSENTPSTSTITTTILFWILPAFFEQRLCFLVGVAGQACSSSAWCTSQSAHAWRNPETDKGTRKSRISVPSKVYTAAAPFAVFFSFVYRAKGRIVPRNWHQPRNDVQVWVNNFHGCDDEDEIPWMRPMVGNVSPPSLKKDWRWGRRTTSGKLCGNKPVRPIVIFYRERSTVSNVI